MMKYGRSRGFTLVELLVVISIISLLLAILMPSLKRARELARKVVCSSQLKQLALTHQIYTMDSDNWICPGRWNGPNIGGDWLVMWNELLSSIYGIDQDLFACPSDKIDRVEAVVPDPDNEAATRTYTFNGFINGHWSRGTEISNPNIVPGQSGSPCKIDKIEMPMNTILHGELSLKHATLRWDTCFDWMVIGSLNDFLMPHKRGSNFMFIDGHVEFFDNVSFDGFQRDLGWYLYVKKP